MSEITLSICIATYNRGSFIGQTISSILSQNVPVNVEIVILNSGSTDDTEKVIFSFESPIIKYFYHKNKFGVDIDYNSVVEYSRGKYCWLFTDDDLLKPDSISCILNLIDRYNSSFDYLVVNSDLRNLDMSVVYKNKFVEVSQDVFFDTSLESQNRVFSLLGDYLSFIGCLIVNRSFWNNRVKIDYFGSEFIHVGVLFQDFYNSSVYFVADPLVSIRLGNSNWTERSFKIWVINWPNLIMSLCNYDVKLRKKVCKMTNFNLLWKTCYYRAIGAFNYSIFSKYSGVLPYSISMKLFIYLISITPKLFFKIFILIYSKIRNRDWVVVELLR
jgi:abequosyltransferase